MKNIILTDEQFLDLTSLMTYCSQNHPSGDLKKAAKRILEVMFQDNLFTNTSVEKSTPA